jgi:competence protein ComEC
LSVAAILAFTPAIRSFFPDVKRGFGRSLTELFCASLAAWIGLSPAIAYYFGIVSPVAILANMVVVPYLSVIVGGGFLSILMGLASPAGARIFMAGSEGTVRLLIFFLSHISRLPGAYFYTGYFSIRSLFLIYVLICSLYLLMGRKYS